MQLHHTNASLIPQPHHIPHLPCPSAPDPHPDAHMTSVSRRPRPSAGYHFLRSRETASSDLPSALNPWIEGKTLRHLDGGRYISLDRAVPLVRSTISIAFSHDGRYYASTHGDHSVKVFEYPSGNQIACLDGHPRTPWTVRFHPSNSSILASGCIGYDCRIWNVPKGTCIRRHTFSASISCVSFSPDGSLLAVTSGRKLLLWGWLESTVDGDRSSSSNLDGVGPGLPFEVLEGRQPFHMVDFHPSGTMLMTGEKNDTRSTALPNGTPNVTREQFTLKLIIHRFDGRLGEKYAKPLTPSHSQPVLVVPRAVAYNDAGIHFSPCGTMLAACIPVPCEQTDQFYIAILSLIKNEHVNIGTVLYKSPLDRGRVSALTNLKFSPTSRHLLAGFSFRSNNPVLRDQAEHYDATTDDNPESAARQPSQVRVVDIYNIGAEFNIIRSLWADMDVSEGHTGGPEDEINVAVFAPTADGADGIVYGTQKGRIRMFQQATGPVSRLVGAPLEEISDQEAEWTGEMANRWCPKFTQPPIPFRSPHNLSNDILIARARVQQRRLRRALS